MLKPYASSFANSMIFILCAGPWLLAQDGSPDPFEALRIVAGNLDQLRRYSGQDDQLSKAVRDLPGLAQTILEARRGQRPPWPSYLAGLKADVDLILRASRASDIREGGNFLKIATEDLRLKSEQIRLTGTWATINKTVITKSHDNKILNGCIVTCVPRALHGAKQFYIPFDNQSSPARKALDPGVYLVWATHDGVSTQPERMDVGALPGPEPAREIAVP